MITYSPITVRSGVLVVKEECVPELSLDGWSFDILFFGEAVEILRRVLKISLNVFLRCRGECLIWSVLSMSVATLYKYNIICYYIGNGIPFYSQVVQCLFLL